MAIDLHTGDESFANSHKQTPSRAESRVTISRSCRNKGHLFCKQMELETSYRNVKLFDGHIHLTVTSKVLSQIYRVSVSIFI